MSGPAPPDLNAVVAAMLEAIELERGELRARLGPLGERGRVRLGDGRRVLAEPGAYTYELVCALEVPVPDGTSVRLEVGGESSSGEVLRFDRDEEILAVILKADLGTSFDEAWASFDPSSLLGFIGTRLRLMAEGETRTPAFEPPFSTALGLLLLTGDAPTQPAVPLPGLAARGAQRAAIEFAVGQQVAYLWGPPGTGKTRTLALLVHQLVERGEQVLLVAHTNVATDTALRRVLDLGPFAPGQALRLGPYGEALVGCGVGLDEAVDAAARAERPGLVEAVIGLCIAAATRNPARAGLLTREDLPLPRRLRLALAALEGEEQDPAGIAAELAAAATEMQTLELSVVGRARVVATTLTRASISRVCQTLRPATVIIDEASTAPLVTAFAAAALATRRVVAVGDFLQLSPIAVSPAPPARRWLARHVFTAAGCARVDSDHPLRVLLDEQWRMHPQISAVVSRTFYGGRLRDAPAVVERSTEGFAIALVDSDGAGAVSRSTAGGSKENAAHALLLAELAIAAAPQREVAVITPYRAQVRRIRELVRSRAPGYLADGRIEVFSVHRFQGRERSLVLFDTAEAPGTAPRFLDDLHNPDAARLINVALSRAIDRLVIVFHGRQLATLGPTSSIGRVLSAARAEGARELLAEDTADRARLLAFVGSP